MRRLIPRPATALAVLSVALLPPLAGRAQEPEESRPSGFKAEVSVGYVLVPVVVRSRAGYVTKLGEKDFELTVDGQRIEFESFEKGADAPVSLLLVQDLSGSMGIGSKLDFSRDAVRCFLRLRKPGDRFALASFTDGRVGIDVSFTSDVNLLERGLRGWRAWGRTALYDAISWIPELVLEEKAMKRAALLITDGADNASLMSPAVARDRVRRAELPVYVIGLGTGSPYLLDADDEKLYRYADVLNLIAHLSGGGYYPAEQGQGLTATCQAIVRELRHQYVLGFAVGDDGPVRYRNLEVKVPGKHLTVAYRRGYSGRLPRVLSRAGQR